MVMLLSTLGISYSSLSDSASFGPEGTVLLVVLCSLLGLVSRIFHGLVGRCVGRFVRRGVLFISVFLLFVLALLRTRIVLGCVIEFLVVLAVLIVADASLCPQVVEGVLQGVDGPSLQGCDILSLLVGILRPGLLQLFVKELLW